MGRAQVKSPDSDQLRFGVIEESISMKEWPGIPEWRGRFWLPDSSQVQPGGKNCLVRDDGGARQLFAECFAPGATRTDVASSRDGALFRVTDAIGPTTHTRGSRPPCTRRPGSGR
jgi:hypothetical protein